MIKNDVIAHDRFGNEIKIGTEVIYAEYNRNSNLYIGEVTRVTAKSIFVKGESWGERRINKNSKVRDLIVKPQNYVE